MHIYTRHAWIWKPTHTSQPSLKLNHKIKIKNKKLKLRLDAKAHELVKVNKNM